MMMTSQERVYGLFAGKVPDKTPIYFSGISSRVASAILGREAYVGGGIQQYREVKALWEGQAVHAEFLARSIKDALDLAEMFDCDLVRAGYWRMNRKPDAKIDDVTYMFKENAREIIMRFDPEQELFSVISGHADPAYEDLNDYAGRVEREAEEYQMPPDEYDYLLAADARYAGTRALYGHGIGISLPYDIVWLEAVLTRPELVERLLEAQLHIALKRLEGYAAFPGELKLMFGGGDIASQQGTFVSPDIYRKMFINRYRKITEKAHTLGMFHLFASDGNLWSVADDLFGKTAVDGYYEIDLLAGMELATLRRKYPALVLLGGIASKTLHIGTKDDIRREAESALSAAKQYGRIVVGVSNQVVCNTPPENFICLMDYLRNNR